MGICTSVENREERKKSQQIDRELEEDNKKLKRECKILLLGTIFISSFFLYMLIYEI